MLQQKEKECQSLQRENTELQNGISFLEEQNYLMGKEHEENIIKYQDIFRNLDEKIK